MQETLATAPRKERAGCRQTEPLDLLVNRRILLDVGIGTGDVGFRLVVIEVADEILDRIAREELFELRVKLRREGLVMRNDERRPIELADDIRHREGLPRPGHAEERLMAIPRLDRLEQLGDGLALIAARLVIGLELERHRGS